MDPQSKSDIAEIKTDISAIKVDLATHMLRTQLLEDQVKPMKSLMESLHGFYKVLKILALMAAIAEGYRALK